MLDNLKNIIDFYLRNKIKISRKNYYERNEAKDSLGFSDKEKELETYLLQKYNLEQYRNDSTVVNYCQNLYTLYLLDKYMDASNKHSISVVDIGCKNWFYARAEHSYFNYFCDELKLDGVEIDAYRLYSNLYNRYEVAKFYTKGLSGMNYIPDNVMNIETSYDYIVWILPFVTLNPHRYWGLPDKYFMPQTLFEHAYSLLKNNGKMLIINQREEEFEAQKRIMSGYDYTSSELESPFYNYKNKRYVSIVQKNL